MEYLLSGSYFQLMQSSQVSRMNVSKIPVLPSKINEYVACEVGEGSE